MDRRAGEEQQFAGAVEAATGDLLSIAQLGLMRLERGDEAGAMSLLNQVLAGNDAVLADRVRSALGLPLLLSVRPQEPPVQVSNEAKELGAKSLEKGYLNDALKYLTVAHENNVL